MRKQYLRQGTIAVNWLQLYELDFPSILASDGIDDLTKVSAQLLYGDFRSLSDPQYHAYCYAALQAMQLYGQYLAGIYYEQAEKLTEAQNFYLKAETAPDALKKRLDEYQAENKHLKEVIRNITQMNASLMKKFTDLKDKFNSVVPLLQMLPKCRCGKTFISKDTLLHHMKASHPHWPIHPEYEDAYFTAPQKPVSIKHIKKRALRKRLDESIRSYQNDNDSCSDYYSQDSDPGPVRKEKRSQQTSKRSQRHIYSEQSPVHRARSTCVHCSSVNAPNAEHPYEPPRSYSSYVPQSHTVSIRPEQLSASSVVHAITVPGENGQLQYVVPHNTSSKHVVISEPSHNNPKNIDIEELVERAIARSLSAYRPAFQSAVFPTEGSQKVESLPPPSVLNSYGPPYSGTQTGEKQAITYQPEDYEISPTSKTDLKSPIGFRQASEPVTNRSQTVSQEKVSDPDLKTHHYAPIPNYVSSQLGSESVPSLHEKDTLPQEESMPPRHKADTYPITTSTKPTILQATAPVVTSNPNAIFVQPPDNILSPFHVKEQLNQPDQESQQSAHAIISQISRESTLFADDAESHLDVHTAENVAHVDTALTEHVRENWPELFQKPGSLPYNIDLTEPEILRRISVLNRSIDNAVAVNHLARSSTSGYHSSLSSYEEYGSTINDMSHRV